MRLRTFALFPVLAIGLHVESSWWEDELHNQTTFLQAVQGNGTSAFLQAMAKAFGKTEFGEKIVFDSVPFKTQFVLRDGDKFTPEVSPLAAGKTFIQLAPYENLVTRSFQIIAPESTVEEALKYSGGG